jgi:hypothetical protein
MAEVVLLRKTELQFEPFDLKSTEIYYCVKLYATFIALNPDPII